MGTARPSDLGTRFLAWLIDYAIAYGLVIVIGVLSLLVGNSSLLSLLLSMIGLVVLVAGLALMIVPMGRTGQTIGGAVTGVSVVDASTGAPVGVVRALARWLIWVIMGLPCYLGYLSYLIDQSGYQRGFNDKAADSIAVAGPKVPFADAVKAALATLRP